MPRPAHRRLIFALLCLVLGAVACQSGPHVRDEAAGQAQPIGPIAAPEIDLPMPAHTVAVVRIDPRRAETAVASVGGYVEAVTGQRVALEGLPSALAGAALISPQLSAQYVPEAVAELMGRKVRFEALDAERPMLAAVSLRGNEAFLRQMELGVPGQGAWALPQGLSLRAFLPASDAKALRGEIEALCEKAKCRALVQLRDDAAAGYVVADLHYPMFGRLQDTFTPRATPERWEASDPDYFGRDTVAVRAFLERPAALSVYVRTEDVAAVGAYVGGTETAQAVEVATPENRAALMLRGLELSSLTTLLRSPGARQFEDHALLVDGDGRGGLTGELYQTYTAHGAAVADAARRTVAMPTVALDAADVDLQWALDAPAAFEAARVPGWMAELSQDRAGVAEMAETFRVSGIWAYLVAAGSYPLGLLKGLERHPALRAGGMAGVFAQSLGVVAVRARLNVTPRRDGQVPVDLEGGLVLAMRPNAGLDTTLGSVVAQAQAAGWPVALETREADGLEYALVRFGPADKRFGEPLDIEPGLQTIVDLGSLADRLAPMAGRGPEAAAVGAILRKMRRASLATRIGDKGQVARLQIFAADGVSTQLEVPRMAATLAEPAERPACLQRAVAASRARFGDHDRGAPGERAAAIAQLIDALKSAAEACQPRSDAAQSAVSQAMEAAADIELMVAHWRGQLGAAQLEGLRLGDARSSFEAACAAGNPGACQQAELLAARGGDVRLAPVGRAAPPMTRRPASVTLLGPQGLSALTPGWLWPSIGSASDASDAQEIALGRLVAEPMPVGEGRGQHLVALVVSPTVGARELTDVLAYIAEHQDDIRRRRDYAMRDYSFEPGVQGAAALVETADGATGYVPVVLGEVRPTEADLVVLTPEGVDLHVGRRRLTRPGCADDGPALCAQAPVKTVVDRVAALDETDAEQLRGELDALAETLRVDEAAGVLAEAAGDAGRPVVVVADGRLPAALLLRLAASLVDADSPRPVRLGVTGPR